MTQVHDIPDDAPTGVLTISPEQVFFIIVKAREFDAKDPVTDPNDGSNPTDDGEIAVLEDHRDDPTVQEIISFINAMSVDEQVDLVALAWLGRDDYTAADWASVREEAAAAHNKRTATYLLGMPQLGDFLEEGLALLGYSLEEYEKERLGVMKFPQPSPLARLVPPTAGASPRPSRPRRCRGRRPRSRSLQSPRGLRPPPSSARKNRARGRRGTSA